MCLRNALGQAAHLFVIILGIKIHTQKKGDDMKSLRVAFKETDSTAGVTRETLQRMAQNLGKSETAVVHMALARLANETLPGYEADEQSLSDADLQAIRKMAQPFMPKGRVIKKRSLL